MAKKLYKDLISTSGTYLIVSLISITIGIAFPRLLGPDEWGLWSITAGLIGMVGPVAQMAMSTTLVTYISKYKKDKEKVTTLINSAYLIAVLSSLLVALSIIALSGYLAESVFEDSRLGIFFLSGSAIIFFEQLNIINRDYFRGFKDFKKYNLLKIVPSLSVLIVALALFFLFSYKAIFFVYAQVGVFAVIFLTVLFYLLRYESTFKPFKGPNKKATITVLKFGVPLIFTMTFVKLMKSMDRVLVGYFLEAADVGVYSVAAGIPLMIGSMLAPVSIVLLPTFSERKAEGISSSTLLGEILSFLLFISIPLTVILHFFSGEILRFIYGTEYLGGDMVLSIAALEILLFGGYVLFRTSIQATEKTGKLALAIGVSALLNFSLNLVLIPLLGIEGAAVGTVASFFLLFLLTIYMVNRNYKIDFNAMNLKAISALAVILTILGYVFSYTFSGVISIFMCAAVFAPIWFALVHISSPRWYEVMIDYIFG
ncbi:MAG: flippase [Thermoplasmata archaeon]